MITTKLYLDTRNAKDDKGKKCPIKVVFTKKRNSALLSTGIYVTALQWDKKKLSIISHPNERKLNLYLSKFIVRVENTLIEMEDEGKLAGLSALEIKEYIKKSLSPSGEADSQEKYFNYWFERFMSSKSNTRTVEIYTQTLKRIKEFSNNFEELTFEDINKSWLESFDKFLSKTSPSKNARNIHFRNIRAVFNYAIQEEATNVYPFRKFKLKNEPTLKRSLSVEQIRNLFNSKPWNVYQEYLDIFKLIFYLCGINLIDLFNLKEENIHNGRIEYRRAKTGKLYSILIEPEAAEILNKYKGNTYLINIHDRYKNHKDYMQHLNKGLSKIGEIVDKKKNGVPVMKPICPNLTSYWARHSWATIAAELEIPKETIAAGLGHSIGSPITSIYIDFNLKKVDEANRKIIDYILYNKVKSISSNGNT